MKKFIVMILIVSLSVSIKSYTATPGVIVYYEYPKIVIATNSGYTYGEIYGYVSIYTGYKVIGGLESYGFKDIYCLNTDEVFNMYIQNFWASRQRVQDWIHTGT